MFSLQVKLSSRPSPELWDLVSGLLYQFHTQGINEGEEKLPDDKQPLVAANEFEHALEPGVLSPPQIFSAYFESRRDAEKAQRALDPHLKNLAPQFEIVEEENKNYAELWKGSFQPVRVPPNWLIRASWHEEKAKAGEIELIVEPGMAFGTGSHPTTRSCLTLISEAVEKNSLNKNSKVLDFGCGSGILAIALKKQGAGHVEALDIDPLAVQATVENAKRNAVQIAASRTSRPYKDLDLIVANILKNTLLEFADRFFDWLKPKGFLILSGLLLEQEEAILSDYRKKGFDLVKRIELSEHDNETHQWVSLLLKKS